MGEPTAITKYVTITQGNEQWNYANGRTINENEKSLNKHIDIFKIARAMDGNETNLSEEDFEKLAKNQALVKSFGYTLQVEDKNYTLTSEKGESISFKFENFLEACGRKMNEYNNKRAAEKREKDIQNATEGLPKLQKKHADRYGISFDNKDGTYKIEIKKETSVATLASNLGLNELKVAKAFEEELKYSALTDRESIGLYDEEANQTLQKLRATIHNYEDGAAPDSNYSVFNEYIIPEGFELSVEIGN